MPDTITFEDAAPVSFEDAQPSKQSSLQSAYEAQGGFEPSAYIPEGESPPPIFKSFIPMPEHLKGESIPGKVGAAGVNFGMDLLGGAASPGGLLAAPLGLLGRAGAVAGGLGFGVPAVTGGLKRVYEAGAFGDLQEALEGGLQAATGGLMTLGGVRAIKGGPKPVETVKTEAPEPTSGTPSPTVPEPPITFEQATSEQTPPTAPTGEVPQQAPSEVAAKVGEVAPSPTEPAKAEGGTTETVPQEPNVTEGVTDGVKPTDMDRLKELTEKVESGAKLTAKERKKYVELRNKATGTTPEEEATGITQGPGAMTRKAEAPESYEGTSIKNAVGDLERVGLGLQDAPQTVQRNMAESWDRANRLEETNPGSGEALAKQLVENPEIGLTDDQSAMLLRHKVDLFNRMNDAAERSRSTDPAVKKQAQAEYDLHKTNYEALLDAVKLRGAEWGREGRWRQAMAKEDFSFASTDDFNRYYKTLSGKELPEERLPKVEQLADGNKRAQGVESQAETRLNDRIKQVRGKTPEEKAVWESAQKYLENNKGLYGFDDIRNKIATDLGMTAQQVTEVLGKDSATKRLADDFWNAQRNSRRLREQARNFIKGVDTPGWQKALASIPRVMFSISVGIHGTVALGTHAPMVAFEPQFWGSYFNNFGKMYKMVFSPSYYEAQMADLVRRPNYIKFRRAGLQNDPFQYDEFHTGVIRDIVKNIVGEKVAGAMDAVTSSGNRGYSVLKLLRQDMADQLWSKLPDTTKVPEMASGLATDINHVTGTTKRQAPPGSHIALFAPRLMGSRVMWLAGDPAKMTATFANWTKSGPAERQLAMNQLKEKAQVFATMSSLLAMNQGLLSASGSKQKINGIPKAFGGGGFDPLSSDFMKFKVHGMDVAYGSAMMNMAKLPVRMATAIMFEGKTSKLIMEDERVYNIALGYIRTQLSPAAGTMADLAFGRDYAERPLPRKLFGTMPGEKSMPKRMKEKGTKPYTWEEYLSERLTPIPISEGLREVFKGQGLPDNKIDTYIKAFAISSIMAGTGTRITEDTKKVTR